jgi:uncharacterized protein
MRHLKKFNESVNSIDDTFDNIYWQGMEPDESIKKVESSKWKF